MNLKIVELKKILEFLPEDSEFCLDKSRPLKMIIVVIMAEYIHFQKIAVAIEKVELIENS
jgi:hypothetical protein